MSNTFGRPLAVILYLTGLVGIAYVAATAIVPTILILCGISGVSKEMLATVIAAASPLLLPLGVRAGVFRFPDGSAEGVREVWRLLATTAQLALVALLLRSFNIEHEAFHKEVASFVLFGFLLHHGLAPRFRLPFFVVLSAVTFVALLGARGAITLIAIGLLLIGICHLRAPFWARASLLLAVAAVLAAGRVGALGLPVSAAVWPMVGSFFMFRTISYIYDLRGAKTPVGIWNTLAYFFLLPNIAFPLFPIVDFNTMRRTYYDRDAFDIYQKGLRWLLRGIVYLLLYRYVYRYLVIAPTEISNTGSLARYLVSNFLLLLQVLGQFDLAVGVLHLFGFNLPETNNLNLLSRGFADFWRRTNTYWRDFVMKVIYYPTFFRVRQWGNTTGLLVTIGFTFAVSAILHAYQTFWILGTPHFTTPDTLFWTAFGALLLVDVYFENRKPKKATLGKRELTTGERVEIVLRTAGMFVLLCLLWGLWNAPSTADWWSMLAYGAKGAGSDFKWAIEAGLVLVIYWATFQLCQAPTPKAAQPQQAFLPRWAAATAVLALLFALSLPSVYARSGTTVATTILGLKSRKLNRQDDQQLVRGYYEDITQVSSTNPDLWNFFQPGTRTLQGEWVETMGRQTRDLRLFELLPDLRLERPVGVLTTNRWGMRDRDYELSPPPDTYRAVLIGGSYLVGRDVADSATFEHLVEERLNQENRGGTYARHELLNLGVSGYGLIESLTLLELRGLDFKPNAVYYVGVEGDMRRSTLCLIRALKDGVNIQYDEINDLLKRARVDASLTEDEASRRLKPFTEEVFVWACNRMASICRERGILPVWVYLPPIDMEYSLEEAEKSLQIATEAGFVVVNLDGVYGDVSHGTYAVSPTNHHLNALGNEVVAAKLYEKLVAQQADLRLGLEPRSSQ